MLHAGATIYIAIYVNNNLYIVPYTSVRVAKFLTNEISVTVDTLNSWRVKWLYSIHGGQNGNESY
jgi:hypothetical protein